MASRFRMPAEWEPHEATWIAWPHEETDWPGKFEPIQWIYGEIVRHLARVERVRILVENADAREQAHNVLRKCHADLQAVDFFELPTDRSWTRDFCPTFVRNQAGALTMLNWRFNGWAKYENAAADNAITPALGNQLSFPIETPEHNGTQIVLEGGAMEVNGAGAILTTEECLLSDVQTRNPGFTRADYETIFAKYLGAANTIWLRNGIVGDDTHGHIDDLARFTDEGTIVIASESDPRETNYEPLAENLALLQERAPGMRVERLPMPDPLYFDEQRLPASFANFYIANETVLVPTFNDPKDRIALNKIAELFPTRTVVGIACTDLVLGLGTLHCMTQQQPV
ncbi:MAG TPA: agmatine deiminase family protein [Bryobacteraceae bacterium]|jgi:agmatine deiminase|nr:agmatine deiminase family protein [Bryobacteraceae bacterium]